MRLNYTITDEKTIGNSIEILSEVIKNDFTAL